MYILETKPDCADFCKDSRRNLLSTDGAEIVCLAKFMLLKLTSKYYYFFCQISKFVPKSWKNTYQKLSSTS